MEAPQNPAGPFEPEEDYAPDRRAAFITVLAEAPSTLRAAVYGLSGSQLETRYRNWTIRQIVHHLADSHVNSYVRFKLALTEDHPTIKPYDEGRWVLLEEAKGEAIEASLVLLEGLHVRWVTLLRAMRDSDYARTFFHPETWRDHHPAGESAVLCVALPPPHRLDPLAATHARLVADGRLIAAPLRERRVTLRELLARIKPGNLHGEVETGPAAYNSKVGLVILGPITSQVKGYPFEASLPERFGVRGVVLSDQVKTLDWRARRAECAGRVPTTSLREVLEKLGALLAVEV